MRSTRRDLDHLDLPHDHSVLFDHADAERVDGAMRHQVTRLNMHHQGLKTPIAVGQVGAYLKHYALRFWVDPNAVGVWCCLGGFRRASDVDSSLPLPSSLCLPNMVAPFLGVRARALDHGTLEESSAERARRGIVGVAADERARGSCVVLRKVDGSLPDVDAHRQAARVHEFRAHAGEDAAAAAHVQERVP